MGDRMLNNNIKYNRKLIPKQDSIKSYWSNTSLITLKSIDREFFLNNNICFKCLNIFDFTLHRSHIVPLCFNGSNEISNIHILCPNCHKESEFLDDEYSVNYYIWFFNTGSYRKSKRKQFGNKSGNPENLTREAQLKGATANLEKAIKRHEKMYNEIKKLVNKGFSYNKIAKMLSTDEKTWRASQVIRIIKRGEYAENGN